MMGQAIKAKELKKDDENHIQRVRVAKKRGHAAKAFKGKTFAQLTIEEKDELLKAVAIKAGIIEE